MLSNSIKETNRTYYNYSCLPEINYWYWIFIIRKWKFVIQANISKISSSLTQIPQPEPIWARLPGWPVSGMDFVLCSYREFHPSYWHERNTRGNPAHLKTLRTSVSAKFKSVNKQGATYSCIVRTFALSAIRLLCCYSWMAFFCCEKYGRQGSM